LFYLSPFTFTYLLVCKTHNPLNKPIQSISQFIQHQSPRNLPPLPVLLLSEHFDFRLLVCGRFHNFNGVFIKLKWPRSIGTQSGANVITISKAFSHEWAATCLTAQHHPAPIPPTDFGRALDSNFNLQVGQVVCQAPLAAVRPTLAQSICAQAAVSL